jgi:glycosyltransferase involved in cell wall biosynthesis
MPQTPETPLVTVVIPTHDRRALLDEAIDSVLAQTYPRWELVVVDDGSTDGTVEHVRARGDARITVIASPRLGHAGRLRNLGIAAAAGELVAFLDSDDVWLPGKLEAQVAALRGSGARWCYAGYELMDEARRTIPFRAGHAATPSGWIVRELLEMRMGVDISTLVVERTLLAEAGGFTEDPEVRFRQDLELVLRLALRTEAVGVPDVLARVRHHAGRITANLRHAHEHTARVYDRFLAHAPPPELARAARRVRAAVLADAGAERLGDGDYALAARLFGRALLGGARPDRWARAVVRGARGRLRRGARRG